jgi:hypothetical protein
VAACTLLLAEVIQGQIINGDFEGPTPASWRVLPGTGQPAGAQPPARRVVPPPRGNRAGHIGESGGVPGDEGAGIFQVFNCFAIQPEAWCSVTFQASWTVPPGVAETASIYLANANGGQEASLPAGTGTYTLSIRGCLDPTVLGFFVDSGPTDPVGIQSRLIIDNVACQCGTNDLTSTNLLKRSSYRQGGPGRDLEDPPLPEVVVTVQPGYNSIGANYLQGANTLDEVLAGAADGTQLFKWNSVLQNIEPPYTYFNGVWQPPGGVLRPGGRSVPAQ